VKPCRVLAVAVVAGLCAGATPAPAGPPGAAGGLGPAAATEGAGALRRQLLDLGLAPGEVDEAVSACERAGMSGAETARVLRLLARARLAGLPQRELLLKLQEGVAKGAGPEAIQEALEHKARVLRQAKNLVDRLVLEGLPAFSYPVAIQAVADALAAGASPAEILESVRQGTALGRGRPDLRGVFCRSRPRSP